MKSREPPLICIVGLDGSGKTTLSQRLAADLQARGLPATYVWCRFESRVLALGLKLYNLAMHGAPKGPYRANTARKRKMLKKGLLASVYRWFVVGSYFRQIRRTILPPLRRGEAVLCDRYVYDSVVDLALDASLDRHEIRRLTDQFLRKVPRPALVIYLDVPPAVAFARKDDVPEMSYLTERHELYLELIKERRFLHIDGTRSPDDVFAEAKMLIERKLDWERASHVA